MAIQTRITQPGNTLTSTLDGQIQTDDGKGRITMRKANILRMIIGNHPDGSVNITISSEGEDLSLLF